MNSALSDSKPWHALKLNEVFQEVKGSEGGLSQKEAASRKVKFGPNQLPRESPPGIFQILLRQFISPLIYILALAALISLAIGEWTDAAFIAGVLLINALIGGYQEWQAEKKNRALERLLKISASVFRDGEIREIDAEEVVPGDVVWIESGDRVPADLRLLWTHGLEIDESALTGESLPVLKVRDWWGDADTPLGDRKNSTFAGTTVVRGRGKGLVVATAGKTVIGQLALDVLGAQAGKPPLLVRLERFTRFVGTAVLFAAAGVALLGLARGFDLKETFFFAIALAVSAIPEGLPVAITVALAVATNRMAKRGVIVRKLAAVEGLGSCTSIASDKTGTLTCNELTVREVRLPENTIFKISGGGFRPEGDVLLEDSPINSQDHRELELLFRSAVLCNEADLKKRDDEWIWRGDPTDIALLSMAHKGKLAREAILEKFPQVNEIPFEPERQFAATYHRTEDGTQVFVKGAPERIIKMCSLSDQERGEDDLLEVAREMAEQGYRVLGFAEGIVPKELDPSEAPPEPSSLKFLGLVGMIDPLREGVHEAINACQRAGVLVSMVTGDHPLTSLAISRELGLAKTQDEVVTGQQLKTMKDEELQGVLNKIRVFSRVTPHEKLRIVEAYRAKEHFVAVTGDGVNDAPALRAANIGVAMGKGGTDVARDASDIVLSDDNFSTIVAGIEEGRTAYNNVRNVIYLLISTGAAEVFMVCLALIFGLPLPLLPVQLLWLNLVTNGIQDVALAFEPGLGNELARPPRKPYERIFNRLMVERTLIGALVIGSVGFFSFYWMLKAGWNEEAARNSLLLLMVLFENIHLGNCRSETRSAFALSPLRSPLLLFGAIIALSIHVLFMYLPIGHILLKTQPISAGTWILLVLLAMTILLAMELHKLSWYLRSRRSRG